MKIKELKYHYIIKENKNRIFGYAFYMLGNKMDAEDAAQEVMIKLWEKIDNFNPASASAYVMRMTHNKCVDYLRRRKIQFNIEQPLNDDLYENLSDNKFENNPMMKAHSNIVEEKVRKCIERLPDILKSNFILYEIHGLKYKEIAEALDLPVNSVKVYLFRARKKLQEELKNYE